MSNNKGLEDAMKAVKKLHAQLMHHKDAGPFLEPVDYVAWNLPDYPLVIKRPMDLGTVQTNLEKNMYPTPTEYADHVHLVWSNCMTYNKEGSDYYMLAQKLKDHFDGRFKKIKWSPQEATTRAPTLAERRTFSQHLLTVGSPMLGVVVDKLSTRCPKSIRKLNGDDIEIHVDKVDTRTFWELDRALRAKRKGTSGTGGGAGAGGDKKKKGAAAKNKRQRKS